MVGYLRPNHLSTYLLNIYIVVILHLPGWNPCSCVLIIEPRFGEFNFSLIPLFVVDHICLRWCAGNKTKDFSP